MSFVTYMFFIPVLAYFVVIYLYKWIYIYLYSLDAHTQLCCFRFSKCSKLFSWYQKKCCPDIYLLLSLFFFKHLSLIFIWVMSTLYCMTVKWWPVRSLLGCSWSLQNDVKVIIYLWVIKCLHHFLLWKKSVWHISATLFNDCLRLFAFRFIWNYC